MKHILILTAMGFLIGCTSINKVDSARLPQQVIGEVDKTVDYKVWAMEINQKYLADEAVHRFSKGITDYLNSIDTKTLIKACQSESRITRIGTSSCTDLLNSCLNQSNLSASSFNSWYMAYERHVSSAVEAELKRVKSSSLESTQKNKIIDWLVDINFDFNKKSSLLGNNGLPQDPKVVMTANSKIAFIQKKGNSDFLDNKLYAEGCIRSLKEDIVRNKQNYKSVTFSEK
jgi:hypothetical protein